MKTFNKIKRYSIITTQHLYCDKKEPSRSLTLAITIRDARFATFFC